MARGYNGGVDVDEVDKFYLAACDMPFFGTKLLNFGTKPRQKNDPKGSL